MSKRANKYGLYATLTLAGVALVIHVCALIYTRFWR